MNPSKTQRQKEDSSLEDLPDELLLHIFTNIQESDPLACLCKVNRRLNRVTTPILYEHYLTPERDSDDDDDDEEEDTNCASSIDYHFVQTLVKRGDLARHVQSLEWYYNLARPEKWDISLQKTAQELEGGQLFFEGDFMELRDGVPNETCDNLFVATVLRTTNLKHLRLHSDNNRRSRANLILKARRSRLGPIRDMFPDIFQHLKSADVVLHMLRLDDVASLMKINTLERLQVGRVRAWQVSTWELGPKTSNISELTLEDCRLHWQNLANVITTCKALTKLSYPGPESIRIVHDDDVPRLKEALDQHADTLESLHFDVIFQHVDPVGIEILDAPDDFGSFSHYQSLREICIYSKLILYTLPAQLVQRLPPTLQTLRLTMCNQYAVGYDHVNFLRSVAKDMSSVEGHLKNIYLSEDVTNYIKCDAWLEVQKVCASYGLNLRVWEMKHQEADEWEDLQQPDYSTDEN